MILVRTGYTVLLLSSALAARAPAQDSAATADLPFRAGQWAAAFQLVSLDSYQGLGVLRFTSPGRAWVLDLSVRGDSRRVTFTQSDTSASTAQSSVEWFLSARVGRRSYRAFGDRVVGFRTLGLNASLVARGSESQYFDTDEANWQAGIFGEMGAAFLPTRRLSIGTTASVSLGYGRRSRTDRQLVRPQTSRAHERALSVQTTLLTLIATIYF